MSAPQASAPAAPAGGSFFAKAGAALKAANAAANSAVGSAVELYSGNLAPRPAHPEPRFGSVAAALAAEREAAHAALGGGAPPAAGGGGGEGGV